MNETRDMGLSWDPTDRWREGDEPAEMPSRFYALLGDPIVHSLSPAMQMAGLRERELDYEYFAIRVKSGNLAALKTADTGLAGFNITAPLKEEAFALCDDLTPAARVAGAVNVVRVEGGRWLGHNSDSGAVLAVLSEAMGSELPSRACILGAGGSARAALVALARWGVRDVWVYNRSSEGRQRFKAWADKASDALGDLDLHVEALPADGEAPVPEGAEVWICCLPGGLDISPYLPVAAGKSECLLLDLRYRDQAVCLRPPLGMRLIDGEPVLLLQGGLSFSWWFGPPVPWASMKRGLTETS